MKNLSVRSSLHDPLNNFFFYKVFGEKGDEPQLLGFINAVLGKTGGDMFTSVEILENKSFMSDIIGGKSCVLDVSAQLRSGAMVNVEVQLRDNHNMNRRSLYYMSREYNKRLKAGQDYNDLPDLIAINIVNYDFPPAKSFHSCFRLREDTEPDIILTNALEIHYINMVKYRKQLRKDQGRNGLDDPLFRWLTWFNKDSPPEVLEEVIKMDMAIQTADERFKHITDITDDEWDAYYRHILAKHDRAAEIDFARNSGHAEGQAEVLALLAHKLSVAEIEEIKSQLGR